MEGSRPFLRYWLPLIFWMAVIFVASTDVMSTERTSRIIGPFLRWFKPDISPTAIRQVQFAVRKSAHLIEYAVLAVLLRRALHHLRKVDVRSWSWRIALASWGLATLCAVGDEVHQVFMPARYGSAADVLLDSMGAALGLAALWLWGRFLCHW